MKWRIEITAAMLCVLFASHAPAAQFTAIPVGRADYQIWREGTHLFTIETRVIGPDWAGGQLSAMPQSKDGRRVLNGKATFRGRGATPGTQGPEFDFHYQASQPAAHELAIKTSTTANANTEAVGVAVVVSTTDFFSGGKGTSLQADGQEIAFDMPVGMSSQGLQMKEMRLTAKDGTSLTMAASRPLAVKSDRGELRIWMWAGQLAAGEAKEAGVTFAFPEPIKVETANRIVDTSDWIEFDARQDFDPGSPIGAEAWLDAPAGKHGWVQIDGQHFVFEKSKTPFKFWGANIAYANMAVTDEQAVTWADKFAKYGVNIVRYHKWTGNNGWNGLMSPDDVLEFDEERCRQFDRFHAEMKARGIYAGWSPIFTLRIDESMAKYIANYEEIAATVPKRRGRLFTNSLYPLQNFAEDVQDFYIAMTVKWLERKNTSTGLRHADDPAVAYVELHNEADIFFPGTGRLLQLYPNYTRAMNERFAAWLSKKYSNDDALKAAWGADLKKDESLTNKNIFPFPPYRGQMPAPQRVVDSYTFLYEYQNAFYDRYVTAIRKTGYRGAIVSGCWQAADMYGHLLNIASDRRAGFIDRHNYFKGERPMLAQPGSALLSAGMQQVADRPFGLTEWAGGHVWGAECQPVLGLIGLGLNGWDYSAQFASGRPFVVPTNRAGINDNFDELRSIGQHPFIARLLYSGDLKEGEVVGRRSISMQELLAGNVGFEERFSLLGGANLKSFAGSVPNEALGAGRVELAFVQQPVEPKVETPGLDACWDRARRVIRASTGQIEWDYSRRGFFTVDTQTAKAVIGFGGGRLHEFDGVSIEYDRPFANVYVAAQKPGQTLANADAIVILVLARTANKGDILEETSMRELHREDLQLTGSKEKKTETLMANPQLIIEPVTVTITLDRKDPCRVYALDHDGCKLAAPRGIPVESIRDGQRFTLDGHQTRSLYYLVDFGS